MYAIRSYYEYILKVLSIEEEKFNKTIDQGLSILADMEKNLGSNKVLSGEDAFKLYDTYGFPIDLTKEILEEKGYIVITSYSIHYTKLYDGGIQKGI